MNHRQCYSTDDNTSFKDMKTVLLNVIASVRKRMTDPRKEGR